MNRESCRYTARYCEENIWHLANDPRLSGERYVVFISNPTCSVLLCAQQQGVELPRYVLWDYHVLLVTRDEGSWVYDLDSLAVFPAPLEEYCRGTFPFAEQLDVRFRPWFRLVEAEVFVETFASDRSHMRAGGNYAAPPPPWPLIQTTETAMNLDRFVNMQEAFVGEVLDLETFRQF